MSDSTFHEPTSFEKDELKAMITELGSSANELVQQCEPIRETLVSAYDGNTVKVPVITQELELLATAVAAKVLAIKRNFAYQSGTAPLAEQADTAIATAKEAVAQFERIQNSLELMPAGERPSDEDLALLRVTRLQSAS